MKKQILVLLVSLAAVSSSAFAQQVVVKTDDKPGWHKIAETTADMKMDRDEITVLGEDHYQSIQLKVTDRDLEITDVTVVFENDKQQNVEVRKLIKRGEETRVIDLDGKNLSIKKIILTYKTSPNAAEDKAHVEIWGMK